MHVQEKKKKEKKEKFSSKEREREREREGQRADIKGRDSWTFVCGRSYSFSVTVRLASHRQRERQLSLYTDYTKA